VSDGSGIWVPLTIFVLIWPRPWVRYRRGNGLVGGSRRAGTFGLLRLGVGCLFMPQ
jgi:hypothetical protein